jgi:hypothetical protein
MRKNEAQEANGHRPYFSLDFSLLSFANCKPMSILTIRLVDYWYSWLDIYLIVSFIVVERFG